MLVDTLWKDYGIGRTKYTKVCLEDIASKLIKSSSITNFMSRFSKKNKYEINGKNYVEESFALEILLKSKSVVAKQFMKEYNNKQTKKSSGSKTDKSSKSSKTIKISKNKKVIDEDVSDKTDENPISKPDDNKIIKMYSDLYQFNESNIMIIRVGNDILFKACDIANILEYKSTTIAIQDHVDSEDKFIFLNLFSLSIKEKYISLIPMFLKMLLIKLMIF